MSNLPQQYTSNALDRASGRSVSPRIERAVQQEVALVQADAIVRSNRAQAVEYVSATALLAVESLSRMEELALQRTPLGDARYKAIVDTATGALARIVAETGR